MERALTQWELQELLPKPRLQQPWHGYTLGFWNDNLQEDADLIAEGKYAAVGAKTEKRQGRDGESSFPV